MATPRRSVHSQRPGGTQGPRQTLHQHPPDARTKVLFSYSLKSTTQSSVTVSLLLLTPCVTLEKIHAERLPCPTLLGVLERRAGWPGRRLEALPAGPIPTAAPAFHPPPVLQTACPAQPCVFVSALPLDTLRDGWRMGSEAHVWPVFSKRVLTRQGSAVSKGLRGRRRQHRVWAAACARDGGCTQASRDLTGS